MTEKIKEKMIERENKRLSLGVHIKAMQNVKFYDGVDNLLEDFNDGN